MPVTYIAWIIEWEYFWPKQTLLQIGRMIWEIEKKLRPSYVKFAQKQHVFSFAWVIAWANLGIVERKKILEKKYGKKHVFSFIWIVEWENYGIVEHEKNLETNIEKNTE